MDSSELKISLCMITKDCSEDLDRCLASIAPFVDEICVTDTGSSDDTVEVARNHGARTFFFKWVGNFAEARNYSFLQATNDWVMWLDSDDIVENGKAVIDFAKRKILSGTCDALLMEYLYEFNRYGHCTTRLGRERFVNRHLWEWRAPIHECLCAKWRVNFDGVPPHVGRVIHNKTREDEESTNKKLRRNLEIFEKEFVEGEAETRMLYYWANTLLGMGRYREAVEKYEEYLKQSPRLDEAHAALIACSDSCRHYMDQEAAKRYATKAITMFPDWPSGYLAMAEAFLLNEEWGQAIKFADEVQRRVQNFEKEMVANPTALKGRPHFIKAYALAQTGRARESLAHVEEAKKWFGDDENLKAIEDIVRSACGTSNLVQSFVFLNQRLEEEGNEEKIKSLHRAVPELILEEPEVCRRIPKVRPNSDTMSVAIVCPPGPQLWGHDSILKGGVGGSEEAVINMSRELADRGCHVEVYAHTRSRGLHEGVAWYPFRAWSGDTDKGLDVVIFWRVPNGPRLFGVNAKATYLWLHDIAMKQQWDYDTHEFYDGIMCLSRFHRGLFDWVPEEKIFMTENAMDPGLYVPFEEMANEPHRLVWGSCPSRGLQHLLPWWGYIREKVPDAEIDIFYGFTQTYRTHMQQDPALKSIFDYVEKAKDQDGINWHGMVSQDELHRAYARSGVWLYMTTFPEIFCITALKMQAHGVWPVVPYHASLPEVIAARADMIEGDMSKPEFQKKLADKAIYRMLTPPPISDRKAMAQEARQRTWGRVAEQWLERFRRDMSCSRERRLIERGSTKRVLSTTS